MNLRSSILSNPYFSLLSTAWKYAKNEKRKYIQTYVMFIINNVLYSLQPIFWGIFINDLQQQGTDLISSLWFYVGIYLLLRFSQWAFHGPARIMERVLAFNMSKNFLEEMYHKTVHLPIKWHQENHSGATINRVRKAYDALRTFFDGGFRYLEAFSNFAFAFAAMLYFSPLFGTIALIMGIGIMFIILQFDKPYIKALDERNERQHELSSTLFDSLSNIVTVITLRLEQHIQKGILEKVIAIFPPFKRAALVNEWKWFVVDMLVNIIYVVIIIGYVYQNYTPGEVFLIGGLVTLVGYANRFISVFHDFAWLYTEVVQHDTDVKTAQSIIKAYDELHQEENNIELPSDWQELNIKKLHFFHATTLESGEVLSQGLHDIAIQIERGKKIALIGESGSGKSTLLALLRGLYPPKNSLEVHVDKKVEFSDLKAINKRVTLIPQEPEIFENTIEHNITMGLPFEQKELDQACGVAHFQSVVEQLPNGLQSSIKEKGVNLSGGQKQRLALARGVFVSKFSDIILLDEPTSSVDPKTEVEIYDQLFATFEDKAVVSSLHRLHLLTKFDYVYILDQGRIVDEGTFTQLRYQSPIFQALWQHQEEAKLEHTSATSPN